MVISCMLSNFVLLCRLHVFCNIHTLRRMIVEDKIKAAIEALAGVTEKDSEANTNGENVVRYTQAILNLANTLLVLKDHARP